MLLENNWAELVLRWVIGIIFVYASIHKIADPAAFAKIIYGYYLFPYLSINLIAIILPFLEFYSGIFLLLGIYPRSATAIIIGLLFGFITAISINLLRGHEFDCGCFSFNGSDSKVASIQLLVRDIFYFVFSLYIIFFKGQRRLCVHTGEPS
ncbi:MAG: DoxX family membrane protein [Deltaproteobacteria bacterium]|nr:DoxX family membrane protein [Deltaproteobacteria bacterium]MBW1847330.1 DoxX family membrane protein [Deltaproteobacteria bacterium]MBW2365230.1 DoxX family membrane protein [Deltaproteobacteria bacterium]